MFLLSPRASWTVGRNGVSLEILAQWLSRDELVEATDLDPGGNYSKVFGKPYEASRCSGY